jgi:DNA-binding MarR family transcriptional regulator
MAERLITAGLVTRRENPADRRTVRLTLTDTGRRTVAEVTARRRAEIADIVTAIPTEQRTNLIEALRTFARAGNETPAPDIW